MLLERAYYLIPRRDMGIRNDPNNGCPYGQRVLAQRSAVEAAEAGPDVRASHHGKEKEFSDNLHFFTQIQRVLHSGQRVCLWVLAIFAAQSNQLSSGSFLVVCPFSFVQSGSSCPI